MFKVVETLPLDPLGLSFIFTAGMLALLSPCGFPMLPGYISYYLGTKASLEKAVPGGVACTLGLATVFSVIGIVVSTLGSLVSRYLPLLELGAGVATILMGVFMVIEIRFPISITRLRAPKQKGLIGIFLYGAVYGLATMGCSAPIFFSILFYAIAAGGPLYGTLTFLVYAIGMGLPIVITTILVAKAKVFMLQKIVNATPLLQKVSGIVLVVIGIYLIYFYFIAFYAI